MWIHIVIFVLAFGFVLLHKIGWIRLEVFSGKNSIRLFLAVAVCGNLLGMAVTLAGNGEKTDSRGLRLEKESSGMYEEEFRVSVDGEAEESVRIQIPGKEPEETDAEPEEEKETEAKRSLRK